MRYMYVPYVAQFVILVQDRTDILSVLANDIISWTSLNKQEEARIPETAYPHEEVNLTLTFLLFILSFHIYYRRKLACSTELVSCVNGRKN